MVFTKTWLMGLVVLNAVFSTNAYPQSSMSFPRVERVSDRREMLNDYLPYLRYVLSVGKTVDATNARLLAERYDVLRKKSPEGAARFLKGLRFEMEQHLEIANISSRDASTANPRMKQWVKRFIGRWAEEVDELLYRSNALAKR